MSHDADQADAHHSSGELLVRRANDIGNFFRARDELPRDALRQLAANNDSQFGKQPAGGDAG